MHGIDNQIIKGIDNRLIGIDNQIIKGIDNRLSSFCDSRRGDFRGMIKHDLSPASLVDVP